MRGPVKSPHEKHEMVDIYQCSSDMPLQCKWMFCSMWLIELEGIIPNQLLTIVIHQVHNPNNPGPHDDDFNHV